MKTKYVFMFLLISISQFAQNQPRNQNVVAGEYFINRDPSEGRGTSLSSSAYGFGSITINQTFSLSNNDALYIRFKSSNGKWSAPSSFKYKQPLPASGSQIQAGEYYINNDPGYGKATGFNIGYDGKINLSLKLNKNDKIFVRAKDSYGRWGDAVCVNYRYKVLIGARLQMKLKTGTTTQWYPMTILAQSSPSPFYTALSASLNYQPNNIDSYYIQFQSDDDIWGNILTDIKEIKDNNKIPTEFLLSQNYPNPFNPSTKIKFDIPKQTNVKLVVYDILGRVIERLVDKEMLPGSYAAEWNAQNFSSGVYFYRIEADGFVKSSKMVLIK